jgi:hypothetical protein
VSAEATILPVGTYTTTVWFTNLSSGAAQSIPFRLQIHPVLQNGGFETGSFAYWALSGSEGYSYVCSTPNANINNPKDVHSGNFAAWLGMNSGFGYLSQTLSTVPGQSYLLSLCALSGSGIESSNELAISWDGITIFDAQGFATYGWTNLQFIVSATSDITELEFSFNNASDYFRLDDIVLSNLQSSLSIVSQPLSQVVPDGGGATFFVLASGPHPLTYQWQKDGTNLVDAGAISGSATANLSVSNAVVEDGGNYAVVLGSGSQSVTSVVATLTILVLPANCAVSPPIGLISWWTGNNTADDLVGTNNATLVNGATYEPGEVGFAFALDGVSGSVDFGNTIGNFGTNDFTIDFWMKTTSTADAVILSKRDSCSDGSFWDITTSDGYVNIEWDQDTFHNNYVWIQAGGNPITDGLFHHVAAVRQAQHAQVYVDGALRNSVATSGVTAISNSASCLGGVRTCGPQPWAGALDDVRIYNRALLPAEIEAIYQAGTNGMCIPTPLMFTGLPSYSKPNSIVLNARLRSGQSYSLQANTNLALTNWLLLTNFTAGTAPAFYFTNSIATNIPQEFFRIVSP